ncbi:hypothetical protein [Sinorhizobium fredii]|uniref:Uncharacterized protein n=1 Tax=Sinorhizobium fredii (strain HH103) TaxID=1117943 RepID=A0A0A8WGZ0_SINF1|nr:hypothetical protein [Sinorhizobium fredii]CEL26585.1 hypothetical protein [Sinorhizobium fredii HH103]
MPEVFEAAAQYDDWEGSVAADNDVDDSIQSLLASRGMKSDGEALVGLSLYSGEAYFSVSAYLVPAENAEAAKAYLEAENIPNVKKVDIENVSAEEFFRLFKRFSVALSWKGMNLIGRELNTGE